MTESLMAGNAVWPMVFRRWATLAPQITSNTAALTFDPEAWSKWAGLGLIARAMRRSPVWSWETAARMAAVAQDLFQAEADMMSLLLAKSSERLRPLADPLATDFGLHRWLASDREEAYSDWLQWVLQRVQRPSEVFQLLGISAPDSLEGWAQTPPEVGRELPVPEGHVDHSGRLDLLLRYSGKALFVLEVKKTSADHADTRKQAGYRAWLDTQPEPHKHPIIIATEAEGDIYEGFRLLRWSELCIGLRRLACRLAADANVVAAALTLALAGAVEQNLLGFIAVNPGIGKPGGFNVRLVAHLERWLSEACDAHTH